MQKFLRTTLFVFIIASLVGCSKNVTMPVITSILETQTFLPAASQTEPALGSTATLTATISATQAASSTDEIFDSEEILDRAVSNLIRASSFAVSAHEVRAYKIIDPKTGTRMIYGEVDVNHAVIRSPVLKIHSSYQYRYDPQDDFIQFDTYTYHENGRYFFRSIESPGIGSIEEINPEQTEPIAGDVYQTLVTYSDQAEFLTESDGIAVYVIEHPKWYTLKSAIGFADLGFLYMQEDGEQLAEQYVSDHYHGVKTIQFTIYVVVDELLITKVVVDDSDFMVSIWAEVDRGLIEGGAKPENLTRYEVMDVNGAVYLFHNYNQVQDFEIP